MSVNHLKPVFSDEPVSPALPPARGCPTSQVPVPILRPPVVLDPLSAPFPVRPGQRVGF